MMMSPFHSKFPKVAEEETRCAIILSGHDLPEGKYFFFESYCNDNKCDCRRVFLNVGYNEEIVATIGYGWESLEFYKKWSGDGVIAKEMKGPILEFGGVHTKYSEMILELFKEIMMNDSVFIERLKRHYEMFKSTPEKVGRNEPCPCGSGIKYKKCCLKL